MQLLLILVSSSVQIVHNGFDFTPKGLLIVYFGLEMCSSVQYSIQFFIVIFIFPPQYFHLFSLLVFPVLTEYILYFSFLLLCLKPFYRRFYFLLIILFTTFLKGILHNSSFVDFFLQFFLLGKSPHQFCTQTSLGYLSSSIDVFILSTHVETFSVSCL